MIASPSRLARLAATTLCALSGACGVATAGASAATISVDKACYVNVDPATGAPVLITGTGFTPGDDVELSGTGVSASATADANGDISVTTPAPILSTPGPGSIKTVLTATDQNASTGQTITASTLIRSANLAVSTQPGSVRNVKKDKVTFTFSGFTPGKHIYGFYLRKKIVAKIQFGKASGPCGTLRQRALLFPGGHPHNSTYSVGFQSSSRYSKKAFPRVTGNLTIIHF